MAIALAPYLETIVKAKLHELPFAMHSGYRTISIKWSWQVDATTGVVTATPSHTLDLTHDETLSSDELETIINKGFVVKTIYTFGPLVQLIPNSRSVMIPGLNKLGISVSLLSFYVLAEDATILRAQMRELFTL